MSDKVDIRSVILELIVRIPHEENKVLNASDMDWVAGNGIRIEHSLTRSMKMTVPNYSIIVTPDKYRDIIDIMSIV